MDSGHLSLRQRKLLNFLQSQTDYISGPALAQYLHVSPRTVRSDIREVNDALAGGGIRIDAKKREGYRLCVDNPEALDQLKQLDSTFLTKEDRVRYLAFTLCLSDIPVNIYDLEDEMYVSHTTLENDIHLLKVKYVLSSPYIQLNQKKGFLEFEKNERKRRQILNHLFHEDWNYNTKENAYYSYEFLDNDQLELIMTQVNEHLSKYAIALEDTNLVALNLAIAIMHRRTITGHGLPEATEGGAGAGCGNSGTVFSDASTAADCFDTSTAAAIRELMDDLEQALDFKASSAERTEIYKMAAHTRLLDANQLNFSTVPQYFDPSTIKMADAYLDNVRRTFHIDLTRDEDFYITLLQYIRYLKLPYHSFNTFQINPDMARAQLMIEYEIAGAFQEIAAQYLGGYLNHTELMYLAFTISGALIYLHELSKTKFRTAICCHLNISATWALKRKIMSGFGNFLDIVVLLPVNSRKTFDFSTVDLVLSTVNKPITHSPHTRVINISPFMTQADYSRIEGYIATRRLEELYAPTLPGPELLMKEAFWHERLRETDKFAIFNLLISDFLENRYVTEEYHEDVLRRESISTFAFQPGIVLMYSLKPSTKTVLSIATLEHRLTWNSYKIRTIMMLAVRPEDATAVFLLLNQIYGDSYDPAAVSSLKTRAQLMEYFQYPDRTPSEPRTEAASYTHSEDGR